MFTHFPGQLCYFSSLLSVLLLAPPAWAQIAADDSRSTQVTRVTCAAKLTD